MRFFNDRNCLWLTILTVLLLNCGGCGEGTDKPGLLVSGTLAFDASLRKGDAPVLVAVISTLDNRQIQENPRDAFIRYAAAGGNGKTFEIDLSDTWLKAGDRVSLIAFIDNNYKGDVPFPDAGDAIGVYVASGSLTPGFDLHPDGNTGMHIDIDRAVFDYDASISGRITGNDTGDVIVVAYAGDIVSSDFSGLDTGAVMGFERIEKGAGPVSYTLDILPYGRDLPIENLQVFALLDANANNEIDAGDRIGFYGKGGAVTSPLVIDHGMNIEDIDLVFRIDIPEPSGLDMSIAGTFSVPADFLRSDAPVFITVFDSGNPGDILDNPDRTLKYFYKMPPYENYFNRNLSHTDLVPGDKVMIAALWDRDFAGGFPEPTRGDKLGIVVNKNTYQFLTELSHGRTIIPPLDHEFKINKHIYDFSASIDYALDMSEAGSFNVEKGRLIVLAIHVEGVKLYISISGEITLDIDMDYMLAVDIVPATEYDHIGIGERQDPYSPRNLSILTALFEQVVVWEANRPPDPLIKGENHGEKSERTAVLIAILDKNGNGALDRGDEIGYYGNVATEVVAGIPIDELPEGLEIYIPEWYSGTLYLPAPIQRIVVGRNREQRNDGTAGPFWISHFTRVP